MNKTHPVKVVSGQSKERHQAKAKKSRRLQRRTNGGNRKLRILNVIMKVERRSRSSRSNSVREIRQDQLLVDSPYVCHRHLPVLLMTYSPVYHGHGYAP